MPKSESLVDGRVFVNRIYVPRVLGALLCGVVIVLAAISHMSSFLLALLALNSLIWGHVARRIALRSSNPFKAEKRNLLLDSLYCGFWISVMHLKPTPSAIIFSMVAMNNVAVGGPYFLIKGLVCKVLGFVVGVCLFGFVYEEESVFDKWICVPLTVIYPVVLGFAFYSLASELKESKNMLRKLSCIDPLTGLLNRRCWGGLVAACLTREKNVQNSVLVILDVDRFKFVNDYYGHSAGDEVLCILSRILTEKLRSLDSICRYGGDEFCVLLNDILISEASARMQEVCNSFIAEGRNLFPEAEVTLSVGAVSWNVNIHDVNAWVALADKNLYEAKRRGRNQIVYDVL